MSDDIRARIVEEARALIGTPYVHQHREPGVGIDCVGVATMVARALSLSEFDLVNYSRMPEGGELIALLDREMVRTTFAAMRAGDVVCMRIGPRPRHVGILTDYPLGGFSMVHAANNVGVVEHRLDDRWISRIVGAWRFPGVPA